MKAIQVWRNEKLGSFDVQDSWTRDNENAIRNDYSNSNTEQSCRIVDRRDWDDGMVR